MNQLENMIDAEKRQKLGDNIENQYLYDDE